MNKERPAVTPEEVKALAAKLNTDAEAGGYHLNPDWDFTLALTESLLVNEKRYGYQACPCRLASGVKADDLDIICPCDYRDPDLTDYDACFCALYVTQAVLDGTKKAHSIPERRPPNKEDRMKGPSSSGGSLDAGKLKYPVWRCKVCGYICARETPPEVCPICKAKKDRFERIL